MKTILSGYNGKSNIGIDIINQDLSRFMTKEIIQESLRMHEEVEKKIDEIISYIPDNVKTEEDAVKFFANWITNNISYDLNSTEKLRSRNIKDLYEINLESSLYCVITKTAVCSGYSNLLNELLSKVGVVSYSCFGKIRGLKHQWNIVMINGERYYVDLTRLIMGQRNKYFYTLQEMKKLNKPIDLFDY